jgi:hypothetical protein
MTAFVVSERPIERRRDRLESGLHRRPFAGRFRRDGDRPVIVGAVDIPYREPRRLLVLRLPSQPDRLFVLGLGRNPAHAKELGPWHHVDYIAETGQEPHRVGED